MSYNTNTNKNFVINKVNGTYIGQVKWFNRNRGYGFLKILKCSESDEDLEGKDIFVHQSYIKPQKSIYRSLEENEYVQFELCVNSKNILQAYNVTGLYGGTLLCDAYHDRKNYRRRNNSECD